MLDQPSPTRGRRSFSPNPLQPSMDFNSLSLPDLLEARNLYHLHLTERHGIVGTAVGRYLIRREDSWPHEHPVHKGNGPKTLDQVEIRPYSWPCVVVFVERWQSDEELRRQRISERLPDCLRMPNGKIVPVCVVEAPSGQDPEPERPVVFPKTVIGGGYPVLADVQGEERVASIGCLVSDGRLTYALTNRHVAGRAGDTLYSLLGGQKVEIGRASDKQLGRLPFGELYEGWTGERVYVNADVGLVELFDKTQWTPQIYGVGPIGPLADLSIENLSLRLVGCDVKAYGCMAHEMAGHVWALFFRYKSVGGFEFVSDLFIGPRPGRHFQTFHGDSGTLWLLEPGSASAREPELPKPLAVQWGGRVIGGGSGTGQAYALATLLSSVCAHLEVDLVRDWGQQLPQYWGTVGHFTIANLACGLAGGTATTLRRLMTNNLENITFQLESITDKATKGLSKAKYIPLADVPDLMWKLGPYSRGPRGNNPEGPNHFADMDQTPPDGGKTLLELCADPANIVPDIWISHAKLFEADEKKQKTAAKAAGLLPFRVWQIYDEMVRLVKAGDAVGYVAAAGVLAHYVGDACQPLHVSYLHHGDPEHPVTKTVKHTTGKKAGTSEEVNLSEGVHADYEQNMFARQNGEAMKTKLAAALKSKSAAATQVRGGREAAVRTVELMRATLETLPPRDIVSFYDHALTAGTAKSEILNGLWKTFGDETITIMARGCQLLALLWKSAWNEGGGNRTITADTALGQQALASRCQQKTFLASYWLTEVGAHLQGVPASPATPPDTTPAKPVKKARVTGRKARPAAKPSPPTVKKSPARARKTKRTGVPASGRTKAKRSRART